MCKQSVHKGRRYSHGGRASKKNVVDVCTAGMDLRNVVRASTVAVYLRKMDGRAVISVIVPLGSYVREY